jgi:transcriptional regulator with XRE-family HTH domain
MQRTNSMMTEAAVNRAILRHDDAIATGRRVASAREYARLSQTELAAFAGMSRRTLHRIEIGERVMTPPERAAVARGLGVSLAYLTVGASNGTAAA